jgi:hypothetical protein
MTKWIIGLGVLVIIGAGLWWSGVIATLMPKAAVTTEQQATTTPQQQTQQQAPVSDLPTAGTDNSDAALVQDSAAVDAQLTSLNSDSATIDNSMNDKPVTQEF